MLTRTFQHLPGVGPGTEASLWKAGLRQWGDLDRPEGIRLPPRRLSALAAGIGESRKRAMEGDFGYFEALLPAALHWRLFPHVRDRAAYLDIETTGLDAAFGSVTTIALYDGARVRTFIQGRNLDDFPVAVAEYGTLITYNGKCFDVPFLERFFRMRLDQVHIDLRYVLKSLGFGGGLKGCERALGLDRGDLAGVDGFDAVLLWAEWRRTGRTAALETLLAYNTDDVLNLETLMVLAYNRKLAQTPFAGALDLPLPAGVKNPFRADPGLVRRLRAGAPGRF
jgi:uncharacterized protein YprB with RNaseH-like and TPR domain